VTVRRSTEFAKCQSLPWKTRAYPSIDKISSEFPADPSKREIDRSHVDPTKAQCSAGWKLVQQDGIRKTQSTLRDLSFLRIFRQKRLEFQADFSTTEVSFVEKSAGFFLRSFQQKRSGEKRCTGKLSVGN